MTKSFDWTHLQSFVAVAQHGSLSGAGRALGGSQPTMGRHVSALETELGVRLFERTAGGLELTPSPAPSQERAKARTRQPAVKRRPQQRVRTVPWRLEW